MPHVYIVILNYLKWQDTVECLQSLLRSSCNDFSVIVIDNDSRNGSIKQIMSKIDPAGSLTFKLIGPEELSRAADVSFMQYNFIQNNSNAGFAGGINPVLRHLMNEDAYIWLLNPDMVVEKDGLSNLIRFAARNPVENIIGTAVSAYGGNHELLFYGGGMINFQAGTIKLCKKAGDIPKLDFISGGSLFTHASNFKKLGLLPENYFLYWEDTDWSYSAKQKGFSLDVCIDAICYDKISSVIGKSFLGDYYYAKNGLLFLRKYRRRNISKALFFMSFRFLKRIISGNWKRAGGIWKGTMDFLKLKHHEGK